MSNISIHSVGKGYINSYFLKYWVGLECCYKDIYNNSLLEDETFFIQTQ